MSDGPHWSELLRQKYREEVAVAERRVMALRTAASRLVAALDRAKYRAEVAPFVHELLPERQAVEEALEAFPGGLGKCLEPLMKETEEETREI